MRRPIDRIADCDDGKSRPVAIDERAAIVVHRCGMGGCAAEISAAYQQHPEAGPATGYQMPYTIVIRPDGFVEQALRLGDYGPHACAWNEIALGVACIGDFRSNDVPHDQWQALVAVCHVFSGWIGGASRIFGHDELDGGSADPAKRCPGEHLDMDTLRARVREADLLRVRCAGYQT